VSHDLRTPLAAIMGSSSTIVEHGESLSAETRAELAEGIYEEAERLNRLIANLLDATRLEAGVIAVRREWHSLEELLGVVFNRLAKPLQGRPCTTSIPANLPLVPVDAALVEQLLVNLIENAVRHTPPGTPIEISAAAREGSVLVSVEDRGPGIPPGEEERIFERFQHASSATASRGIGLGLTVCRGIATAHGGRIWAENRPGGGAAFRFTLPLVGSPPALPVEAPLAPAEPPAAGAS